MIPHKHAMILFDLYFRMEHRPIVRRLDECEVSTLKKLQWSRALSSAETMHQRSFPRFSLTRAGSKTPGHVAAGHLCVVRFDRLDCYWISFQELSVGTRSYKMRNAAPGWEFRLSTQRIF